jgi:hypothetical protein
MCGPFIALLRLGQCVCGSGGRAIHCLHCCTVGSGDVESNEFGQCGMNACDESVGQRWVGLASDRLTRGRAAECPLHVGEVCVNQRHCNNVGRVRPLLVTAYQCWWVDL